MLERRAFLLLPGVVTLRALPRAAAPKFQAKSMTGESFTNDSLKGQVVLIQFWTTWCGVCRGDQPAVDAAAREYAGRLVVLAVSVGESRKRVARYLADSPRPMPVVLTEDTNLATRFEIPGFPKYVLIGKDGALLHEVTGGLGRSGIGQLLAKAGLEEPNGR